MAEPVKTSGGKPQNRQAIIIAAIVIGLLLLVGGCKMFMRSMVDRAVENAIESGSGVEVDRRGNTTTYTDKDGNKVTVDGDGSGGTINFQGSNGEQGSYQMNTGDNAKIPEGFPSSFPVLLGGRLTTSYSGSEGAEGDSGFHLQWEVDGSVADAVAYYQRELAADGWTVVATSDMGAQTIIVFERDAANGDKDGGSVMVSEINGKTNVTVNLGVQ